MALVELEGFVRGAGLVVEELAAVGPGHLVGGAVQDQERQHEAREVALDALVGADQRRDGLGRLHLVLEQRVRVHRAHHLRVAGEVLVLQTQDVGVRRDVAEALQHRQREVGGRDPEGEVLADEAGQLGLVVERVDARDDAAGAVAEQEERQAGLALLGDADQPAKVVGPSPRPARRNSARRQTCRGRAGRVRRKVVQVLRLIEAHLGCVDVKEFHDALHDPNPPKRNPRSCAARINHPSRSSRHAPGSTPEVPHPESLRSSVCARKRELGAEPYERHRRPVVRIIERTQHLGLGDRSSTIAPAEGSCRGAGGTRVSENSPAG